MGALSGQQALEMIRKKAPDLILLDINMPEMNGFEVAKRLKGDPELEHIPVIFISALDDLDSKLRAFECDGVDYICKPFEAAEVLARVKTQLELLRLRRESLRHAQEMEHFAFMAAHDLKAPCNAIETYCNMLMGNQAEVNDSILKNLKSATGGLRSLVDGLLELGEST